MIDDPRDPELIRAEQAYDSQAALREFVDEMLHGATIQAQLGQTHAQIGDDAGLEYALRRLVAYVKAAAATLYDLKTAKAQGRAQ